MVKKTLFLCVCLAVVGPQAVLAAPDFAQASGFAKATPDRSPGKPKTPTAKEGCAALCPVCSHYKDGSCQEVKVGGKTPKAEYEGKTYYFCSPSCKKTFLRKPKKFVKGQ